MHKQTTVQSLRYKIQRLGVPHLVQTDVSLKFAKHNSVTIKTAARAQDIIRYTAASKYMNKNAAAKISALIAKERIAHTTTLRAIVLCSQKNRNYKKPQFIKIIKLNWAFLHSYSRLHGNVTIIISLCAQYPANYKYNNRNNKNCHISPEKITR